MPDWTALIQLLALRAETKRILLTAQAISTDMDFVSFPAFVLACQDGGLLTAEQTDEVLGEWGRTGKEKTQ
jgi:hypothetical protein